MAQTKGASVFDLARDAEQRGNRDGRDLWERYAPHRQRQTDAILALAPPGGGRLCLLGAGNGNDSDFDRLAARFDEIHLVDIDPAALSRATNRQTPAVRAKLRSHAPVDLSGLFQQIDRGNLPSVEAVVDAGVEALERKLPRDFDVVTSCCVLSQMAWSLARIVPDDADLLATFDQAMVSVHLRTLMALAKVGGDALIVADLISSDRYPLEEATAETDLPALVSQLAEAKVAFAVSNPVLIKQVIRRDRKLVAACEAPRMGEPWLWTGSLGRTYLVYPMVIRRRA